VHKIIPLVVFVSVSLIIGNQVAFAETNVWAFYGEEFGSKKDATNPGDGGTPPLSSMNGIANPGTTNQIVSGVQEYQNVANAASAAKSGPLLVAQCFQGIPNPKTSVDDWVFGGQGALPFQCVQNQRNARDLGLGVQFAAEVLPLVQPLEVEVGQLVVIDLSAILGTHENFMFRISSNSGDEEAWVAVSDKGPEDTPLDFDVDFDFLGPASGLFPGGATGSPNNDSYISFIPKNFLYFTQTIDRQDILLQQIKADVKFIPPPPPDLVGGHGGITDNTALLVSGSHLTASWMIPLIVSEIGVTTICNESI